MKDFINNQVMVITQYELNQIFIEFGNDHAKMVCGVVMNTGLKLNKNIIKL